MTSVTNSPQAARRALRPRSRLLRVHCTTRKMTSVFRRNHRKKSIIFLCAIIFIIIIFIYKSVHNKISHSVYLPTPDKNTAVQFIPRNKKQDSRNFSEILQRLNEYKYVLQWTSPTNVPFVYMGVGNANFVKRKCRYTNCYVTSNYSFLGDVKLFDAVVFAGPEVVHMSKIHLPLERDPHQKYVFASIESADNYPLCSKTFDGIFNWTWTYKLDSDVRWGYVVVRDARGRIVGPNNNMYWMKTEDMLPVYDNVKNVLRGKTKAAAWFVSNCHSRSRREHLASYLGKVLKYEYNLTLDIYGECGSLECPKDEKKCDEMLKTDYFFYLSFENGFSDDYVTEKIIRALANNVVPIVYGGANYTRFLPEGSYLDAVTLDVDDLAAKINESVHNLEQYSEYFRWINHYSYQRTEWSPDTDEYCMFCELLNDEAAVKKTTIYDSFSKWWDAYNNTSICDDREP